MMNFKRRTKVIITFCLIVALCLGNVYNSEAAKKIKSKSVAMTVTNVTMGVGDVVTLSAVMKPANSTDTLKWSTSNKKIATVNKYGTVTAKEEGTVTITVKTSSKKKATCKITIKKYLTEDEIASLISADCLAEETIIDLIKKNSITEDKVKELIKSNSISEDAVKTLIKENTLTEEDIKKIVQENVGTSSGSSNDWEDGTELILDKSQTLPLTKDGITINEVTIKKEHYNGEREGVVQKYKYYIEIKGVIEHLYESESAEIQMVFFSKNNESSETRNYSFLKNKSNLNVNSIYTEDEEGNFVLTVEQYQMYSDYNTFMINQLELWDSNSNEGI